MDYAIVRTGGKQYRVSPGDIVDVERLPDLEGPSIQLTDVLAVSKDGALTVGTPTVEGARVHANIQQLVKGEKITVFKYRRKTRYRRKLGHRQQYSRIEIQDIEVLGVESAPAEPDEADPVEEEPVEEVEPNGT